MLKKYKGKSEDSDDSTSDSEANDSCAEVYDVTDFTDCDTQEAKVRLRKISIISLCCCKEDKINQKSI